VSLASKKKKAANARMKM